MSGKDSGKLGRARHRRSRARASDNPFVRTQEMGSRDSNHRFQGSRERGGEETARGKRCHPPPQFLRALRDSPEPSARLTSGAEDPGGREATEAANCPGRHHLEQERTKVELASSGGQRRRGLFFSQPVRQGARCTALLKRRLLSVAGPSPSPLAPN